MFCIGLHPWEKDLLSQRNLTKLFLKRSTCSSVEDFEKAVAAVTDEKKSIGSAAKEFNVPCKTLSDGINGRHSKNVGKPTYLTEAEESSLIGYIEYMASHRFPLNIKQICAYAWAVLFRSGWPENFCKTGPSEK